MMRKILFSVFLLFVVGFVYSQSEGSVFTATGRGVATTFVTDYQACGINPANLGWNWRYTDKKFAMGYLESSYSLYSEALRKQELRGVISEVFSGNYKKLSYQQKVDAAKDFVETGLALNVDLGSFGFAYSGKKFGGIAFKINDRFQYYSQFGKDASNLLFMGKTSNYFDSLLVFNTVLNDTVSIANYNNINPDSLQFIISGYTTAPKAISKIFNNSQIRVSWIREYNLSYGRRIVGDTAFAIYGGVGFKFFQGMAMMDLKSENEKMEAFSSLSPIFDVDYGKAAQTANQIKQSGVFPKPVGTGFGLDFGLNAVLFTKLKLGFSFINMGSITWKGNVYTIKDTLLFNTTNAGLNNYNIPAQLKDIIGSKGLLELKGVRERTVKLPGMIRAGASYAFSRRAEIGFDAVIPITDVPGSYKKPIISLGGDIMPLEWLKLQMGFVTGGNYDFKSGGNFDFQIPCGLIISLPDGSWEAGIASRDAITFFVQKGPTLSMSMGFMRFRF